MPVVHVIIARLPDHQAGALSLFVVMCVVMCALVCCIALCCCSAQCCCLSFKVLEQEAFLQVFQQEDTLLLDCCLYAVCIIVSELYCQ